MAEQLKYNDPSEICFITTRTALSKLWFINNSRFCEEILGYLAKYQQLFQVEIYHFIIMGNHYHLIARFPRGNRHLFMKLFNRIFSNAAKRHIKNFEGGRIWARRYRPQVLIRSEDVKHWFYYSVLNPIISGLVKNLSDYPSYNGFKDAISGRARKYSLVDWEDYMNRKRGNSSLSPSDCTKEYELKYSKLPGLEELCGKDYRRSLLKEFEERRKRAIEERKGKGLGFAGAVKIRKTVAGAKPFRTKTSSRNSRRPLALSLCPKSKKAYLEKYFTMVSAYSAASRSYRRGDMYVKFPAGTFLPPMVAVVTGGVDKLF